MDAKKRSIAEQIIGFRKDAESGISVKKLRRRHNCSQDGFYAWRRNFGSMTVSSETEHVNGLESENMRLKKLRAGQEQEITREAFRKKW